jgi:hypothetical protein
VRSRGSLGIPIDGMGGIGGIPGNGICSIHKTIMPARIMAAAFRKAAAA